MSPEARIKSLESQVQALKRMFFGVFGSIVVVGGMVAATSSQSVRKVIRASAFEVVNDDGKIVGDFSVDQNGAGVLGVRNRNGVIHAGVIVDTHGGSLIVSDTEGAPLARIGVDKHGGTILVEGSSSNSAVNISTRTYGGAIAVVNNAGDGVAVLGALPTGGLFGICNNDGKSVVELGVARDGDGVIQTLDNKGKYTSASP